MYPAERAEFDVTTNAASGLVLVVAFVALCAIAAIAIGRFPLEASIATIFLFAGVHNLMEFRYFAARMPAKWGRSRNYYLFAIAGVVTLTAAYLVIYFGSGTWIWSDARLAAFAGTWNTAFVLWAATLFWLHGRRSTRSDRSWIFPAAFLLAAVVWMFPQMWSIALVYIHPLVAMWFLDRQIRRTKPEWTGYYRLCLMSIPLFLLAIWVTLAGRPQLPDDTFLFWRITQHAGSGILTGLSSHLLVATHVFLESIHYFVWILLIPLVDRRAIPWRLDKIPLVAGSGFGRFAMVGLLIFGAVAVCVLWLGFSVDYATTRDVYFAFAIAHVLAEFPFLIKML